MGHEIDITNGKTVLTAPKGLSAFQLKVIALVIMTVDHIGAFAFEIPLVMRHQSYLRAVGRLAMPIFLFLLVQSIRHTRSKRRFILRLYLAGMGTELFVTAMNLLFGDRFRYFTPRNIIFTFFYTALYAVLIERLIESVREKQWRTLGLCVLGLALSLVPTVIYLPLLDGVYSLNGSDRMTFLLEGLLNSVVPSFYLMDYGIGAAILGVVMYFAGTKKRQCIVYAVFCALCIAGRIAGSFGVDFDRIPSFGFFETFFDYSQNRMIWALPFMLLYNGQRGRPCKWFFYWYYPVHRELIWLFTQVFFPLG